MATINFAISIAVVTCLELYKPEALVKWVLYMPSCRAFLVINCAKFFSVPPNFSASTTAESFAETTTRLSTKDFTEILSPEFKAILILG